MEADLPSSPRTQQDRSERMQLRSWIGCAPKCKSTTYRTLCLLLKEGKEAVVMNIKLDTGLLQGI